MSTVEAGLGFLLHPKRIAEVQGLELKARLIVEGYLSGSHRSPDRGFSVEFAEHREYVPGDDLRYVDWKVFGKSDRIYLKQFDEETNFGCVMVCDASESMNYRSEQALVSKLDYAKWIAAALSYVVIRQHDAAGLAIIDDTLRELLRPGAAASQFREVCRVLEQTAVGTGSSVGAGLQQVAERVTRRGVVVVLSDLFDDFPLLERGLRSLAYRRHDVILLQILDPAEIEFPFRDPTRFLGLEKIPPLLANPRSIRDGYLREMRRHQDLIRGLARQLKFDSVVMRTDQPPTPALASLLLLRRRRGRG